MDDSYSIYIHIPFCQHRCSYCDFNTYAELGYLIPSYVSALIQEIKYVSFSSPTKLKVGTIFFGGGTPSLLPIFEYEKIFSTLNQCFSLAGEAEITLEANPGTLDLPYLQALYRIGVNRISLGMQSAQVNDLHILERQHDISAVVQSVRWARQAGFDNLNLDLIFGIPHQTLTSWGQTLQMGLSLNPEHLSLYALTLEHGTSLASWVGRGLVAAPDEDLSADMYEYATDRLDEAGYIQYEISNWARGKSQGRVLACQHNLQYWHSLPYLGFGAGAHGFANQTRTANVLSPVMYIARLKEKKELPRLPFPSSPAAVEVNIIDQQSAIGEYMMMGLRLVHEGVSGRDFLNRFGISLQDKFGQIIMKLVKNDLVSWEPESQCLRLTRRGRLLGNQVFLEFL